jgi:hypothetical protein
MKIAKLPAWVFFLLLIIPFLLANIVPFGLSISGGILILWIFLVAFSLKDKIPPNIEISFFWFVVTLSYALIYIVFRDIIFQNNFTKIMILLHIFAVYSVFNGLFFISKLLVIVEEKRTFRFDRYIGTFFLFWFFPIGIWFVQPRIILVLSPNTKRVKKGGGSGLHS